MYKKYCVNIIVSLLSIGHMSFVVKRSKPIAIKKKCTSSKEFHQAYNHYQFASPDISCSPIISIQANLKYSQSPDEPDDNDNNNNNNNSPPNLTQHSFNSMFLSLFADTYLQVHGAE